MVALAGELASGSNKPILALAVLFVIGVLIAGWAFRDKRK